MINFFSKNDYHYNFRLPYLLKGFKMLIFFVMYYFRGNMPQHHVLLFQMAYATASHIVISDGICHCFTYWMWVCRVPGSLSLHMA